jgi:ABC-type glutathione transport system ATPase component
MAKTGKRRSKFAAQAKRLRTKAPPELIAKLREFEARAQAYWDGLPKVSDEDRRELDRAMGRELNRVSRREVQAPQPTTTIGGVMREVMKKHRRAKHEGATDYARRLQASDRRLAPEKLKTVVRRLYD